MKNRNKFIEVLCYISILTVIIAVVVISIAFITHTYRFIERDIERNYRLKSEQYDKIAEMLKDGKAMSDILKDKELSEILVNETKHLSRNKKVIFFKQVTHLSAEYGLAYSADKKEPKGKFIKKVTRINDYWFVYCSR